MSEGSDSPLTSHPTPGKSAAAPLRVDFGYAFATPHRLTAALPDSGDKTLLDLHPGWLRMAWTYDSLADKPLAALAPPKTEWEVHIRPELDGCPFTESRWSRAEGWLPVLENSYGDEQVSVRLQVAGGPSAALVRVELANHDERPHRLGLRVDKPGNWNGVNPGWVQSEWDKDVLLAGWLERADRILIFAVGADETTAPGPTAFALAWELAPGEARVAWLVRPYRAYQSLLPVLRRTDWAREFEEAVDAWQQLIGRAARINIPDAAVRNAFYAGLADCFVMREPGLDGYIVTCPGTEAYRSAGSGESTFVNVLLDQVGLHDQAGEGQQVYLDLQEPDGSWTYTRGWEHWWWAAAGFKSHAAMQHYRLTGDRAYLAAVYPRMWANSLWQEQQRARTRVQVGGEPPAAEILRSAQNDKMEGARPAAEILRSAQNDKMEGARPAAEILRSAQNDKVGGARPSTYGLLPRGMGDCGLLGEDGSYYGVFLPHNIWAVYADALALEAATILGKTEDLPTLQRIYEQGREDLFRALEGGAIAEEGFRWIPGVAGRTVGSRWGALNAAFPCGLLPPDHPLIEGTIRKVEQLISPGGLPVNMGWQPDGLWVAIALDNLAEVLLLRDQGDAAVGYLYATLNHATPIYSWCEERGQEPGAANCTGDRQHLWTPVAVSRFIRDALVMEDGDTLHLARGAARQWLSSGEPLGVQGVVTPWGAVSYALLYDRQAGRVLVDLDMPEKEPGVRVMLHVRLPEGLTIASLEGAPGAEVSADGGAIVWECLRGRVSLAARITPQLRG